MFCPNCGTKNDDAAGFCLNCGTPLVVAAINASTENTQEPVELETLVDSKAPETQETQETQETSATPVISVTPATLDTPVTSVTPETQFTPVTPTEASTAYATPVTPQYKPRKPFSKKMIGIMAGVAVIAVAIIVFIVVGKKSQNYEALATKYFLAEQKCEWDTVFNSIDIPDGEFLTKELLSKAQSKTSSKEISNYSVSEESDIYSSIINKDKELADASISKDVDIEYRVKGEASNTTDTIGVIKLKEKNLLFFDKYKISPDNLIASNYTFIVAKGAKVTINGVEVSSKYLKESTSSSSYSYEVDEDNYVIDYLFKGEYTIKVTQENMEDYEEDVTIDSDDDSYTYTSAKIGPKISSQLVTAGQDAMKTVYDAVVARKDFSTLSSLFVNDTEIQSDAKSTYAYFMDEQITSDGIGLTKVSWTSLTGTASQDSSASDGLISVTVTVKGAYSATLTSAYSTTPTDEKGTITSYFYYVYIDGAWSLYDMDLSEIY